MLMLQSMPFIAVSCCAVESLRRCQTTVSAWHVSCSIDLMLIRQLQRTTCLGVRMLAYLHAKRYALSMGMCHDLAVMAKYDS